jgi:stress-induced morphogen
MITPETLTTLIQATFTDAEVEVFDLTGMQDHYRVYIESAAFEGVPLLKRHQLVYQAVDSALKSGALHALEIKTEVMTSSR